MVNGKLKCGDAGEILKGMDSQSIDLTVTSPPYDNLRKYHGYSFPFQLIARELFRVTKDGGIVVWVVGDETKDFSESLTSFKQALFFVDCGFKLLDTMIYYKQNYAPAYPTLRRYANQFEYMFVFSKGKPKTFNPIQREKIEHRGGKTRFRKPDGTKVDKIIYSTRDTKDASNVWSYPSGNKTIAHPAVMPEKLAEDHILSWSNEGDTILDPFAGSGTTLLMAQKNNRPYIGIEVSEEYCELILDRLHPPLFDMDELL